MELKGGIEQASITITDIKGKELTVSIPVFVTNKVQGILKFPYDQVGFLSVAPLSS